MSLYYYSAETIYDGLLKLKFTEKSLLTCLSCGSCTLCPVRMIYSEIFAISITNNYLSSFGCFNVVDRSLVHLQFFWKRKEKHNRNLRWRNQDGGSKMAVIYFFVRQLTTFCHFRASEKIPTKLRLSGESEVSSWYWTFFSLLTHLTDV